MGSLYKAQKLGQIGTQQDGRDSELGPCLARVRREQKAAAKDARFGAHFTRMYRFPRNMRNRSNCGLGYSGNEAQVSLSPTVQFWFAQLEPQRLILQRLQFGLPQFELPQFELPQFGLPHSSARRKCVGYLYISTGWSIPQVNESKVGWDSCEWLLAFTYSSVLRK
jgi:hypothetical protein